MKLSTYAASTRPQKILVFGPTKSGKTELIAKLANAGYKLLWLDIENGGETILHAVLPEFQDNVNYIKIPDTQANPVGIATVGKLITSKGPVRICDTHGVLGCIHCKDPATITTINLADLGPQDVVVIDSVTQLSDSAIAKACPAIVSTIFDKFQKVEWDHYNYQGMLLNSIFSHVQQLRCNVVCISHEEVIDMSDKSKIIVPVAGTKNYSRRFGRFFDHVIYCYKQNKSHKNASSSSFHTGILTGSRGNISLESGGSLLDMLKGITNAENASVSDGETAICLVEASKDDGVTIAASPEDVPKEATKIGPPEVTASQTTADPKPVSSEAKNKAQEILEKIRRDKAGKV